MVEIVKECIEALGNVIVLADEEKKKLLWYLQEEFEFSGWTRIDWRLYPNRVLVDTPAKIRNVFKKKGFDPKQEEIYILWGEASRPGLKCTLQQVIDNFWDVECVYFETFLYNPDKHYVIECYYMGEINILFL